MYNCSTGYFQKRWRCTAYFKTDRDVRDPTQQRCFAEWQNSCFPIDTEVYRKTTFPHRFFAHHLSGFLYRAVQLSRCKIEGYTLLLQISGHLRCRYAEINTQRIPDTPPFYFGTAPSIYSTYLQKSFQDCYVRMRFFRTKETEAAWMPLVISETMFRQRRNSFFPLYTDVQWKEMRNRFEL